MEPSQTPILKLTTFSSFRWLITCRGRLSSDFRVDLETFGDPYWDPFWDQIGPRGVKMGSRGPPRTSKYQIPAFTKTFENDVFFAVFGRPRPSKTASEDPRTLSRGYLGLLEASLSHPGAVLKVTDFKIAPAG